jgi:sugar transferase (PEP-CTERM/EpsH1 system associated)
VLNNISDTQSETKLLIDFMDVDSDKWRQYATNSSWPKSWIYSREAKKIADIERASLRRFDQCFLIADAEIALFKSKVDNTKLVKKLNNGMDFSAFYPAEPDSKAEHPTFLFTGVMDYKPNVDAVLWFVETCWPKIKKSLPNAEFIVAGMNPSSSIQALNEKNGIIVTGFVDEILPYYHKAWTFVAPFRLARGVQNKVLQATACGLPIVTTSMGAEGISFATPSYMSVVDDADAFADACTASINERSMALEKATGALEALRKSYSWESKLKPLLDAIEP